MQGSYVAFELVTAGAKPKEKTNAQTNELHVVTPHMNIARSRADGTKLEWQVNT